MRTDNLEYVKHLLECLVGDVEAYEENTNWYFGGVRDRITQIVDCVDKLIVVDEQS